MKKRLDSGLSIPVAGLLATGMLWACPKRQAQYELERVIKLRGPFTRKDREVLARKICEHLPNAGEDFAFKVKVLFFRVRYFVV